MADEGVVVWYNPRCSKCQGAAELLAAYGVPSRRVPREPRYEDLGLADASVEELLDAMSEHPELIERPIVIRADRAVIARPPELLLSLLEADRDPSVSR